MKVKFPIYTRASQLVVDSAIFALAFLSAYIIRFERIPPWWILKQCMLWMPYLIALRLLVNWRAGIYRFIWRYVSLADAVAMSRSLVAVTFVLLLLRVFYPAEAIFGRWVRLPISVIILEFLLSLAGTVGARGLRRILYERTQPWFKATPNAGGKRVVLYGAGRAGIALLRELKDQAESEVVGFIDDDPQKAGKTILGTRILGCGSSLEKLASQLRVDEVIISIAAVGGRTLTEIVRRCQRIPIPAKIIPSLREILRGNVSISQVREVGVEELLGRESIEFSEFDEEVRRAYAGRRILVTGAGGSIGSELVRQLLLFGPRSIGLLDHDENSLFELHQELSNNSNGSVELLVTDLRERERMRASFSRFRPEVVFHAAAYKHVPLMEKHPCEAVLNNVVATRQLLDTCVEFKVERFIFISTDKAVNPMSVMGATKRFGELLVQSYANGGSLTSACVRFGNVMGSRGSVVPLFQKQIRRGGPITVTHPDIVRFFMTISEAVQLVLCAGSLAHQGEVFVLDMGNPRKILDLAHEMARLSGLEPGKDIEITITGLRPGEKLREELWEVTEKVFATRFEKLAIVQSESCKREDIFNWASCLARAAHENDSAGIYEILSRARIGFSRAEGGAKGAAAN